MYQYKCTILRIVDGDTVDIRVDLGFRLAMEMRVRLFGINAPEMNVPAGKLAKEHLAELMPLGTELIVATEKDRQEKYGRYLGTFYKDGTNLNIQMHLDGHAELYSE